MLTLFLNILLSINLYLGFYKKILDYVGLFVIILMVFIAVDFFRFKFKIRRLLIYNEHLFHLLIILFITNNLVFQYSSGLDAKLFRLTELAQNFILFCVPFIPRYRNCRKLIPAVVLFYSMLPPASVLLDSNSPLYSFSLIPVLALNLKLTWSNLEKKGSKNFRFYFLSFASITILIPGLLGILHGFRYNLIEHLLNGFLIFVSTLNLFLYLHNNKNRNKVFYIVLLFYLPKILLLTFYFSTNDSRGGINNNLYAMTLTFLSFVLFFVIALEQKSKLKFLYIFYAILLFISIYWLKSRTPLFAILIAWSLVLILSKSKNYINFKKNRFYTFASFLVLTTISSLFCYLYFFSKIPSVVVRAQLWKLAFKATFASIQSALFGLGDYGKINLLKFISQENIEDVKKLIQYGGGFFQMHLHNDFIALLFGSGFIIIAAFSIHIFFLSKIINLKKENLIFSALQLSMLIYGITEPILTSVFSGVIFWFANLNSTFGVKDIHRTADFHFRKLVVSIGMIIFVCLPFLTIMNFNFSKILKFYFNNYNLRQEIRGLNQSDLLKENEKLISNLQEINNTQKNNAFVFFSGQKELVADLQLYEFKINKNNALPSSLKANYCELFYLQPTPGHFNNIKNLSKFLNEQYVDFCKQGKLDVYDQYQLVPENFY